VLRGVRSSVMVGAKRKWNRAGLIYRIGLRKARVDRESNRAFVVCGEVDRPNE
jgi:hypothetical protein